MARQFGQKHCDWESTCDPVWKVLDSSTFDLANELRLDCRSAYSYYPIPSYLKYFPGHNSFRFYQPFYLWNYELWLQIYDRCIPIMVGQSFWSASLGHCVLAGSLVLAMANCCVNAVAQSSERRWRRPQVSNQREGPFANRIKNQKSRNLEYHAAAPTSIYFGRKLLNGTTLPFLDSTYNSRPKEIEFGIWMQMEINTGNMENENWKCISHFNEKRLRWMTKEIRITRNNKSNLQLKGTFFSSLYKFQLGVAQPIHIHPFALKTPNTWDLKLRYPIWELVPLCYILMSLQRNATAVARDNRCLLWGPYTHGTFNNLRVLLLS